jgi:hypothetical protein
MTKVIAYEETPFPDLSDIMLWGLLRCGQEGSKKGNVVVL